MFAPKAARQCLARQSRGVRKATPFLLRLMGTISYEPQVVEVEDARGLELLKTQESRKKVVVVVYSQHSDTEFRRSVEGVTLEFPLKEYNNQITYAFASYTLDETLPCFPVIDVYLKGERVFRSLGRSPSHMRSFLGKCVSESGLTPDPNVDEIDLGDSTLVMGRPRKEFRDMMRSLGSTPPDAFYNKVMGYREEFSKASKA